MNVSLPKRLWQSWVVEISASQIILAAAAMLVCGAIYGHLGPSLGSGVFDEAAHACTALLCLNLLPERWRRPILGPALLGSVLVDADHLPQDLFGSYALTLGTPRPYTHSLLSIVVLLWVALLWRRRRFLFLGLAVGLALHFLRDMGDGGGAGVSLLWPVRYHGFAYGHRLLLEVMAAVTALGLLRVTAERWRRTAPQRASRSTATT